MQPCELNDLSSWLESEVLSIPVESHRRVIIEVNANIDSFVKWPQRGALFWDDCQRIPKHDFPLVLKEAIRKAGLPFRNWSNDPAIYSYLLAGGERPKTGLRNEWTIHHLYDGQFHYPNNRQPPVRAVKHPRHFTQSAGLVAAHPVAHALADEFAIFAWRLRAESFLRFGYDPEGAFAGKPDQYGFASTRELKAGEREADPTRLVIVRYAKLN